MSEKDNLQEADGIKEEITPQNKEITVEIETESTLEESTESKPETEETEVVENTEAVLDEIAPQSEEVTEETEATPEEPTESKPEAEDTEVVENTEAVLDEIVPQNEEITKETEVTSEESTESKPKVEETEVVENTEDALDEIDASNAEDAEDEHNSKRHEIKEKDYHAMPLAELVDELEGLLKNEKIQTIKSHFETIKTEFNAKFSTLIEEKKEEFLATGGNAIDFHFKSTEKTRFNDVCREYRDKRQAYYKNLEQNLKTNLKQRLEIIEEIKGLINVEENINTTYKHFKELQESWKNAGPIPRDKYNNVWNNYHHHVEIFYDFLHLNRDLRDLDFKHNLEQKLKIIARAEELAKDTDSNRAFRELQVLHKIWKEELGPVDRERREEIWERFSAATKSIHEKRQAHFEELDKAYEKNLEVKHDIISQIDALTQDDSNVHSAWQKKIKILEDLRNQFFNAGKVPIKVNEATWAKFKDSVRAFNRKKNTFYKNLKKNQYENLQKKIELIKLAEANKDNDDFETTTPLMKKIQSDWKKIGHVPRRDSDKIWKQFKAACNHYFDKFHESKNAANKDEVEALEKKSKFLEALKDLKFTDDLKANIALIQEKIDAWKTIGRVPFNKRFIDGKFNKAIDALYGKLDMTKAESDLLKYDNKLATMANTEDKRHLDNEHNFIRKKIDDVKAEINQLENNLQFFSNAADDNPLVKDVHKNIEKRKIDLTTWEAKLRKIKKFY
ncbi:FIG00693349: hypothetical protein [hydrothermal vent metagenome]|uniref:ATPase involved in DNA repair n=1 Tax=hydrothermal vent metagenome TaxID=652676 RepID=A0A3B0QT45_9ZZZZ